MECNKELYLNKPLTIITDYFRVNWVTMCDFNLFWSYFIYIYLDKK